MIPFLYYTWLNVYFYKGLDPSVMVDVDGKETKIIKAKLNSLRLDSLLKAGLGIAKK